MGIFFKELASTLIQAALNDAFTNFLTHTQELQLWVNLILCKCVNPIVNTILFV